LQYPWDIIDFNLDALRRHGVKRFISDGCEVADGAIIGSNVKVMPGRQIGSGAIVEAGVVVLRNIPAKCRVGLT